MPFYNFKNVRNKCSGPIYIFNYKNQSILVGTQPILACVMCTRVEFISMHFIDNLLSINEGYSCNHEFGHRYGRDLVVKHMKYNCFISL